MADFNWGIISTGAIASSFVKDLLIDPKTRDTEDVVHRVVAVGSRSVESAQKFVDEKCSSAPNKSAIKAYGSYEEVFADASVQAIYIGTPHTLHYPAAIAALKAKKAVLCEKPVTSNKAELDSLLKAAEENGVFFMEAMWTRFQPLMLDIIKLLQEKGRKSDGGNGELGRPRVVQADLSVNFGIENMDKKHRLINPELGGGALLDLGPYPLVWALCSLFIHPVNKNQPPSSIVASMLKTPLTGVDAHTSFILNFETIAAQAILSCAMTVGQAKSPGASIRCENGTIKVFGSIPVPSSFTVEWNDEKDPNKVHSKTSEYKYTGMGYHFQADEVARCVRKGALQSDKWSWELSRQAMSILDEVRKQGNYEFPDGVEWVKA